MVTRPQKGVRDARSANYEEDTASKNVGMKNSHLQKYMKQELAHSNEK